MKRFFAGLFAIALVTGCSSLNTYNSNSTLSVTQVPTTVTATSAAIPHTQTPSATQTASTSVSTQAEIRSDLILGENYNLKSLGIVFQNLYRSKDKAGRDGLLVEYTKKMAEQFTRRGAASAGTGSTSGWQTHQSRRGPSGTRNGKLQHP